MSKPYFLIFTLFAALLGCAATKPLGQVEKNSIDPYENVNRKIHAFNDGFDDYIAKPISGTYQNFTPEFIQTGITNFFNNLGDINVIFNDFLQAKLKQGGQDTRRFLMNTTLGLAGFFDVATTVGLERHEEDFEQTLAVWGVPQGKYLVIPFLGPITYRGIPGAIVDTAANPVTYTGAPLLSNFIGAPIQAVSLIDKRARAEGSLKFIDEAALDPYVFMRESFLQWRKHLATDGKSDSSDLLELEMEGDITR